MMLYKVLGDCTLSGTDPWVELESARAYKKTSLYLHKDQPASFPVMFSLSSWTAWHDLEQTRLSRFGRLKRAEISPLAPFVSGDPLGEVLHSS